MRLMRHSIQAIARLAESDNFYGLDFCWDWLIIMAAKTT